MPQGKRKIDLGPRPCLKRQKSQCSDEPDGRSRPQSDKPGFGFTPGTKHHRIRPVTIPYSSWYDESSKCINGTNRGMCLFANGASFGFEQSTSKFLRTKCSSATYPPKATRRSRKTSGRFTSDLDLDQDIDTDTIYPQRCETVHLPHPPSDIPDCVAMSLVKDSPVAPRHWYSPKKKADQESVIYITHPGQTETVLGDHFGANLKTFYNKKRKYYQHFVSNITPGGVAYKMHLEENDELVLIDGEFVPELNHSALLNVFHNVPVDGRTRFYLVIRRIVKMRSVGKQWEWFETSAVLHSEDQTTEIAKLEFTMLPDNDKVYKYMMRFNIPGTSLYLDINRDTVSVGTLQDNQSDESKIINQLIRYKQKRDGSLAYESALQGYIGEHYLELTMTKDIVTKKQSTPIWFGYSKIGSKCMFCHEGVYIGFDPTSHRITGRSDEFGFCRKTLEKQHDFPDGSVQQLSARSSLLDSFYFSASSANSSFASSANSSFEEAMSSGYDSPHDQKACPVTSVGRITRSMSRADSIQNSDVYFQKLTVND